MGHAGSLQTPCKKVVIGSAIKIMASFSITEKPRFNKSKGILFFIAGILLFQGLFTIKSITEGLEIKFFIAEILLLKVLLYRGLSVLGWSGFQ
jgi:hypothetical protein